MLPGDFSGGEIVQAGFFQRRQQIGLFQGDVLLGVGIGRHHGMEMRRGQVQPVQLAIKIRARGDEHRVAAIIQQIVWKIRAAGKESVRTESDRQQQRQCFNFF